MKKHFNNLNDSIFITIIFISNVLLLYTSLKFGLPETGDITFHLVTFLIVFGLPAVGCLLIILILGFELWYVKDGTIYFRNLLRKKNIPSKEISRVEKKKVPASPSYIFLTEAYIVQSLNGKKIAIYIRKKNYPELQNLISDYLSE